MSLRSKLRARARGEVSTAALSAYASSNADAYSLLDEGPSTGAARLAAWCAFMLQTYADRLLTSGADAGFASPEAFEQARVNYQLVGPWLMRARAAALSPAAYELDVSVPQRLPQTPPERDAQQLAAMRRTLEVAQARAGVELERLSGDPVHSRLVPTFSSLQSALDACAALSAPGADESVFAAVGQALQDGLDRAYELGQLVALPELMARPAAPAPPAAANATTIRLFLPGEPGFDPWCLTDPVGRHGKQGLTTFVEQLAGLWKDDPDPEKTLAIQAEIAGAVERRAADYLPADDPASRSLEAIRSACPWPGVLYARSALTIDGQELSPGDCFVLSVGLKAGKFTRSLARAPSAATAFLPDSERARDSLSALEDRLVGRPHHDPGRP
ncbi:MAG TPA: hypothetical protein VGM80_05040 [Gaiellaceae bacterium]